MQNNVDLPRAATLLLGKGELALGKGTLGEPLLGKGELALGKGTLGVVSSPATPPKNRRWESLGS